MSEQRQLALALGPAIDSLQAELAAVVDRWAARTQVPVQQRSPRPRRGVGALDHQVAMAVAAAVNESPTLAHRSAVTVREILAHILPDATVPSQGREAQAVGRALDRLRWTKRRTSEAPRTWVWERPLRTSQAREATP